MARRLSMAAWFLGPASFVVAGGCGLNTAGESPGDTADVPTESFEGDIDISDDARDRGDGEVPDVPDGSDADADDGDTGPECGDGIVEGIEQCDQGPANSDTAPGACRTSCRWFFCGDDVVDPGEACDDGNTVGGDGCEADCSLITCGDGVVQGTEVCDDGNSDNSDACLSTCVFASCGDGFVWADHEACERTPRACTASCGSSGLQECVDCAWAADCTAPGESCNGLDDDCDTAPDNGFDCVLG
jgi:cysteine-rich repeat protein